MPSTKKNKSHKAGGAPAPTLRACAVCSGVLPPPHLRPEHGYVYPFQELSSCNNTCPFYMCYSSDNTIVNRSDVVAYRRWFFEICMANGCDPTPTVEAFSSGSLPDNVVVSPKSERSDIAGVYVFIVSEDGKRVYVFDMSFVVLGDRYAFQLPCVLAVGRRAAFARLSDAIEESAGSLNDGQFKALYDAAMAAHDA